MAKLDQNRLKKDKNEEYARQFKASSKKERKKERQERQKVKAAQAESEFWKWEYANRKPWGLKNPS